MFHDLSKVEGYEPRISVVIPAYNEEGHLFVTVRGALDYLSECGLPFELIIVDDGSTDSTAAIAMQFANDSRVRMIRHAMNLGLGRSYLDGVHAARGHYVTWIPGDNAIPPEALGILLRAIGRADVIVSYPHFDMPKPFIRRVMSRSFTALVNSLFGLRLRYFNCVTVVPRQMLGRVATANSTGFGVFAEILILLDAAGSSMVEVEIPSVHRGIGSKAFRWRNILSVVVTFGRLWWDLRVAPRGLQGSSLKRP